MRLPFFSTAVGSGELSNLCVYGGAGHGIIEAVAALCLRASTGLHPLDELDRQRLCLY
jgi:hypothetical protein